MQNTLVGQEARLQAFLNKILIALVCRDHFLFDDPVARLVTLAGMPLYGYVLHRTEKVLLECHPSVRAIREMNLMAIEVEFNLPRSKKGKLKKVELREMLDQVPAEFSTWP